MTELTVWDFVRAINQTKENLFERPEAGKAYNAFVVNRHLSYSPDALYHANEVNYYRHAPPERQFAYLLYAIPEGKRYCKWSKPIVAEELKAIMEFFELGPRKAREVLAILTKDQVGEIMRGRENANQGETGHL